MRTVLITGATGFIGVHLVKECLRNDCKVIAVVRPNSKNLNRLPNSSFIRVIELEMEKIEEIVEKIEDKRIDIFYHLAWDGVRVPYRDNPILQNKNYECAIKSMNAAKKLRCNSFIGIGSQAEYGICSGKVDENYKVNPTTEYGKFKLKSYETLKAMAEEKNMKFIWIRIFSAYGTFDHEGSLIMSTIDKMGRNESIQLTECVQNWDYIYVEDVVRILYLLATENHEDGVYNVASGESRQLREFILEMKDICKSKSELQFGALPYNSEGIRNLEPNIDKLKQNLRYSCKVSFKEGINKILDHIN
ncbi:nucleoside-diphosphate-sugar epimerase [Clostridium beijerinckii]|uniref:NAD-dependent epimerase/dehydratase family protein n=1 Tax=Clostridium beijerinckii TaxID=1520 RepID=UPI00156F059A|nr:NAD(P)-dependent oxidoreductase [Clostridium beijerinckii]NRT37017.1 nucleoside-diphosphate-sugar epimerase [Clostridium beijerinckii]NRT43549.1 nucleoside-diphosphate-sugar epimerase [Clostridium beijerinckii]NRZ22459.1 nucleoside-diphosphate-sugar epimerase [Clostridium beijerinckii]